MTAPQTTAEFVRGFFPKGHANRNVRQRPDQRMRDLLALLEKWRMDNPDIFTAEQLRVCMKVHERAEELAHGLIPKMEDTQAIWTTCCLGMAQALFLWINSLQCAEAIYVLEELARLTDASVDELKKKEKSG